MEISGVQVGLLPGTNDDLLSVGTKMEKHLGKPSEKGIADFHDCVVLYDPNGLYNVIKQRLENYPVAFGTKVMRARLREVIRICAIDIPRAFRNQNWMQLLESRSIAQEALLRVAFILNRDYFPRVKDAEWLLESMVHLPKDFPNKMSKYAREHDVSEVRRLLIALTQDLIALATEIWPGVLDEYMTTWLSRLPDDLIPILE